MYKIFHAGFLILVLLSFPAMSVFSSSDAEKGRALAIKLDQRDEGFRSSNARLTMIIKNRNGGSTSRKLQLKVLENTAEGNLSLMEFDFPADIRGTALLTHPKQASSDDQWLFLPSINRVKRISSRNKSGAFVSSEFAFEDLSDTHVDDFTYVYLGQISCAVSLTESSQEMPQESTCDELERIPLDKNSGYSKQKLLIDTEFFRVLGIEYFDVRGKLLKRLTAKQFSLFEKEYWRPLRVQMENVQTGKTTELAYEDLVFGLDMTESDFSRVKLGR